MPDGRADDLLEPETTCWLRVWLRFFAGLPLATAQELVVTDRLDRGCRSEATSLRAWAGTGYRPGGVSLPAGSLTLAGLTVAADGTASPAPIMTPGPYRLDGVRAGGNPMIEILGVVLFDFGKNDTAVVGRVRDRLSEDLAGAAPSLRDLHPQFADGAGRHARVRRAGVRVRDRRHPSAPVVPGPHRAPLLALSQRPSRGLIVAGRGRTPVSASAFTPMRLVRRAVHRDLMAP